MRLKGIRTNCTTNETTEVQLTARLKLFHNGGWAVTLDPGVTGYESAFVHDLRRQNANGSKQWVACAGTSEKWDILVIPAEEMEKLMDVLNLLPI